MGGNPNKIILLA